MRVRQIKVSGWQCFANEVVVGPFADGINVVHAPNGTGKSTIFAALRRALLDGHRAGGEYMKSLRPWGREVAPCVCIDFEHDGVEYRLEKRFLDGQYSKLHRRENGKFVIKADGDNADEQVRKMLLAKGGAGAANKPESWGLAEVLWVPQGALSLGCVGEALSSHIQSSLGAQVAGDGGGKIEKAIENLFLTIFTPTGDDFRRGKNAPAVVLLEERLAELRKRRAELVPQVTEFEEASRRVEDLRATREQARRDEEAAGQQLKQLAKADERWRALDSKVRELTASESAARQQHAAAQERIEAIAATRKELEATRAELATSKAEQPGLATIAGQCSKRLDDATAALQTMRVTGVEIERDRSVAEDAARLVEAQTQSKQLAERLARIASLDETIKAGKAALARLVAPTTKQLNAIRKTDAERAAAQAKVDASLITLQIVPLKNGEANVRIAEEPGAISFRGGEPIDIKGSPQVVVEIAEFGQIRASGPAGSLDDFRAELESTTAKLAKLTQPFGSANIEELAHRAEQAIDTQKEVDHADAARQALLGDETADDLEQARGQAEKIVASLMQQYPQWEQAAPEPVAMKNDLRTRAREQELKSKAAELEWEQATVASKDASAAVEKHAAKVEAFALRESESLKSLSKLESDQLDDSQRVENAKRQAVAWAAATAQLEAARKEMNDLGADPADELVRVQRTLDALQQQSTRSLEEEKRAEGRLEKIAQLGAWSRLGEIEDEIAAVEADWSRESARAAGIKLLRDVVCEERKRAIESVSKPVETLATQIIARIAGPRIGAVKLDAGFGPEQMVPPIVGEGVGLEALSGGETEQVHLAVRLALADVLSRGGNQLVVLDDILVATDSGRLSRVQAVLEEFAQKLQILVLTCHPERYRGLADAKFIDLEAIALA